MENLNSADFDLTEEEIDSISALDKGLRFNDPARVSFFFFSSSFWEKLIMKLIIFFVVPRRSLHLCLNAQV